MIFEKVTKFVQMESLLQKRQMTIKIRREYNYNILTTK